MSFSVMVLKNLARRPIRTALTLLGISIGITTVVALGVVTSGLKDTAGEIIRLGDADFMVAQDGAADLSFSIVAAEDVEKLADYPEVERAEGMLFHIARVGSNPYFFLIGRRADDLAGNPPPLREGELWAAGAEDEILLGSRAADDLGAGVGDTVEIEDREFRVSGIHQSGRLWEDGGAYAPLEVAQEIAGKSGVVTAVFVSVEQGANPAAVAAGIEEDFPNLATVTNVDDYAKVDQGIQTLDAVNIAISVLAVGIGAIGVMNTMVMSVLERTREIGILRAVGWSGRRILRMIIAESLILCVLAAFVGAVLGILATRAILLIDTVSNLLEPQYTPEVFIRALVVAVVVALVGAAYPAFRAVRLTPMEALRYE
ncbi:MAG: ABC transporter permease [Dehalococcoidia bacterium]